jgi:hypothetical protein
VLTASSSIVCIERHAGFISREIKNILVIVELAV